MKVDRIMLAAPKSGSGKTMITCALLHALKEWGISVCSYKCGPDYIDPMFHKQVLKVSSRNLDTYFTDDETTRALFLRDRRDGDFALLEGVMGLFDGVGGIREEGSSYRLAEVTKTPIILVVDAKGMGRSVLPLLAGFLAYDKAGLIKGVILNRTSGMFFKTLKPLIEKELGIAAIGCFPEQKALSVESRHLGLKLPGEMQEIEEKLKKAARILTEYADIESIRRLAASAEEIKVAEEELPSAEKIKAAAGKDGPVIAVALDEAFCFYYEDNLKLLERYGARLVFFSPIHDKQIPKEADAVIFGGGYPELYAKQLSANTQMLASVKSRLHAGLVSLAECGGFLYLHQEMEDMTGNTYSMAGVVPGKAAYTHKLVRFGYVELTEKTSVFLPRGSAIKGHEFHYFDSSDNGNGCTARKPGSAVSYDCVIMGEHYWWGFPHLYFPSNPAFAKAFVEKAAKHKKIVIS